ncbi:hypothetical protein HDU88_008744 [Geranomyces variabilis]|nr:hypothetical protein HDU88_008744 [Geranomyces variabilis]
MAPQQKTKPKPKDKPAPVPSATLPVIPRKRTRAQLPEDKENFREDRENTPDSTPTKRNQRRDSELRMLTAAAPVPPSDAYDEDVPDEDEEDEDSENMPISWPANEHPDVTVANILKLAAEREHYKRIALRYEQEWRSAALTSPHRERNSQAYDARDAQSKESYEPARLRGFREFNQVIWNNKLQGHYCASQMPSRRYQPSIRSR